MTFVILGLFVGLVLTLAYTARRTGTASPGCCAPADLRRDRRMRAAFADPDPDSR